METKHAVRKYLDEAERASLERDKKLIEEMRKRLEKKPEEQPKGFFSRLFGNRSNRSKSAAEHLAANRKPLFAAVILLSRIKIRYAIKGGLYFALYSRSCLFKNVDLDKLSSMRCVFYTVT